MVKDIVIESLKLLDKMELMGKVNLITEKSDLVTELDGIENRDANDIMLLASLIPEVVNTVSKTLKTSHKIEKLRSDEDKRIFYKDFEYEVVSIRDITDEMNSPIVFTAFFDHLKVPYANKDFFVTYDFNIVNIYSLFDECILPLGVTSYIVALGVVSAYLTIKLLYQEAGVFESKFLNELSLIKPNTGARNFFVWRD